jgi:hypothetical protein
VLVLTLIGRNAFAAASDPLLQQPDLQYLGAFKLPQGTIGGSRFSYGGTTMAYNPAKSSLFIVGHDWDQMVAEITIPEPVNSTNIADLNVATVLQPFTDPSEGKMATVDNGTIKVGGLLVSNGKLYGSVYSYYDADGSQVLSHYVSSLDLSQTGDVQGMYQVGTVGAGFVSGYMTHIPSDWQSLFGAPALVGNCCIAIVTRTSYGPAVMAFNPSQVGSANPVPAVPLVYYPTAHQLSAWDSTSNVYNGTTKIRGIAFPNGASSVLFIGIQGLGEFCYGTGAECNDPDVSSKGTHAYPYQAQVWAYDANQLLAAKNGQVQPWDVKPYAIWKLSSPFDSWRVAGSTYDPATGRIYVAQAFGDGEYPIILVYRVARDQTSGASLPASPSNLAIR